MFLVLVAIGTTDLLFALDSIPAVFGVTTTAGASQARPTKPPRHAAAAAGSAGDRHGGGRRA